MLAKLATPDVIVVFFSLVEALLRGASKKEPEASCLILKLYVVFQALLASFPSSFDVAVT